jgi:hypothetical protein
MEDPDPFFTTDGALEAVMAAKKAGTVRSIGCGRFRPSTPSWRATSRRFTSAEPISPPNPDKDRDELLDVYLFVEDADALPPARSQGTMP